MFLLIGLSSYAKTIDVNVNSGWVNLPYCNGKARLVCEQSDISTEMSSCFAEFANSKCTKINMYTASTFYPSVWTQEVIRNINESKKIKIDSNRISGLKNQYFYVFFATTDNSSYTKIKFKF